MTILNILISTNGYSQQNVENKEAPVTGSSGNLTSVETAIPKASSVDVVKNNKPAFALTQHFKNREGGIDGLRGGVNISISQDGTEVYVAGFGEDSISIFSYQEERDLLLYRGVIKNDRDVDSMGGPWDIAISENGNEIYVSAYKDDAIVFFKKNESGNLEYVTAYKNTIDFSSSINGPRELVLSPDGKNLYVVNEDDSSITIFSRNTENGALVLQKVIRNGREVSGLDRVRGIAMSPSGDKVYVVGYKSSTLTVLNRNFDTGLLSQVQSFSDGLYGVDGLFGASTVAVSADGKKVFVTGFKDNALAVFNYNQNDSLEFERVMKNGINGTKGLSQIYKVASNTKGQIYVSGFGDNSLSEFAYVSEEEEEGEIFKQISIFTQGKGGIEGLDGAWGIAVHPSGDVFITGYKSNALSIFSLNENTGLLSPSATIYDNEGQTTGLFAAFGVAVSPDGSNVYVNGISDKSMGIFYREAAGKLLYSANVEEGITSNKELIEESSPIAISGITGAWRASISPDGKHVYVTRYADGALVLYKRNILNGTLTYLETLTNTKDGIHGIQGSYDVKVSYDGKNVYVTGFKEDSLAVFNRASDGTLSLNSVLRNNNNKVTGLDGAMMLAISPDDANVYVTSKIDDSIVVFERSKSDGSLSFMNSIKNTIGGVSGLDGAFGIAIHPEGTAVYVTGFTNGAVAVFNRASDGTLSYNTSIVDGEDNIYGLANAKEIEVSPDSQYLFVTADSSLVIFTIDSNTLLPKYHAIFQNGQRGISGLKGAWGLGVSKDSKDVYVTGHYDNSLLVFSRTEF